MKLQLHEKELNNNQIDWFIFVGTVFFWNNLGGNFCSSFDYSS